MTSMTFIILTGAQADHVRKPSLQPRLIEGGAQAGKYALGPEVLSDSAHADFHDYLAALPQVELVLAEAWPPEEDPAP